MNTKTVKTPTSGQTGQSNPGVTFTKERVNELMKKRVERSHQSFFKRYGVKDLTELDNLVGKSRSYDPLKKIHDEHIAKYDALVKEHGDLNERYLFTTSNINPDRYEDIRTYFKGKGLDINSESLNAELATHPDWRNKVTTFQTISSPASQQSEVDEKALAGKFLGL